MIEFCAELCATPHAGREDEVGQMVIRFVRTLKPCLSELDHQDLEVLFCISMHNRWEIEEVDRRSIEECLHMYKPALREWLFINGVRPRA
jgi:hypothetical protein